jgi:hypothetical protein
MKIFEYDNFNLTLAMPEILLVSEFKAVVDSDKSKDKQKAFRIFQYCFLLKDFRSPYKDYSEAERYKASQKDAGLTDKEVTSDLVVSCMRAYDQILNSNKMLTTIRSMYNAIDKLNDYFNTINFTEKVDSGARKGTLLHSPTEFQKVIKDAKYMLDTIRHLESMIKEELAQETAVRGDQEMGWIMGN